MLQSGLASPPSVLAAQAHTWWQHLLWIVGAAVLGYAVAAIFSAMAALPRSLFLVPHVLISGGFVVAYLRWSQVDLDALVRQHWLWGIVGAVLFGAFQVTNVLSQPASPRSTGVALVWDLLWLGVVYGTVDALLLSVLPILATWKAFAGVGWTEGWWRLLVIGVVALVLSLIVTAAYHLGYVEFRGRGLVGPLIGNGASSLGYLFTGNPLGAIFSHIAMHVASVLHGPATTIQLPPHY
jgi:hypothetical protein